MKVILINTVYPSGSTGRLVESLEGQCRDRGMETLVLYGHGGSSQPGRIKIAPDWYMKLQALRARLTGLMYGGCLLSTRRAIRVIRREKPDVVHLHCLNSNFINIYRLLSWLKENRVNTVLTNHAEFMYTANCGHAFDCEGYQRGCVDCPRPRRVTKAWFTDGTHRSWRRMKRAFAGFTTLRVTNVSPWLTQRAAQSAMLRDFPQDTVLNGVDTSVFTYRESSTLPGERLILHVTANFSDDPRDQKGGRYLIQLAKRMEGQKVRFLVAGKHPGNLQLPPNLELLGNLADRDQLARLYSRADLVVLTSRRETFSMVTAESLCCGTPVVGFRAGAPEQIALPEYSEFVDYGDLDALYAAAQRMLEARFDKKAISKAARAAYSNEKMVEDYFRVYEQCIKKSES